MPYVFYFISESRADVDLYCRLLNKKQFIVLSNSCSTVLLVLIFVNFLILLTVIDSLCQFSKATFKKSMLFVVA